MKANTGRNHVEQDYIPDVAGSLTQRDRKGPRFDHDEPNVIAHTLRSSGFDASEDGTGRGTPLIAIDTYNAEIDGDITHTLRDAHGEGVPAVLRMREGKDGGGKGPLISEDASLTLARGNDQVLFEHYRKSKRAANEQDDETWVPDDFANTLSPFDVGDVRTTEIVTGYMSPRVVRNSDTSNEVGIKDGSVHDTLQSDGPGAVGLSASVRRLTPTECERLQGFPDGWTCVEVDEDAEGVFRFPDGEPYSTARCTCPDGPRYAALGNAVTVSPALWIARRIVAEAEVARAVA